MSTNNREETIIIEEALKEQGRLTWTGRGCSMTPLIRDRRDLVVIEPLDHDPEVMDVVLHRSLSGQYILHRIVSIEDDEYVMLGDRAVSCERAGREQILGIMTDLVRDGKEYDFNCFSYKTYMRLWIRPWKIRIKAIKAIGRIRRFVR